MINCYRVSSLISYHLFSHFIHLFHSNFEFQSRFLTQMDKNEKRIMSHVDFFMAKLIDSIELVEAGVGSSQMSG